MPKKPKKTKILQKALAVVLWQGKSGLEVLLLKRPAAKGGFWQPVTGHLEKGEDFAHAALREAEEETNLEFPGAPEYLGLHYEFEGQWGRAEEKAFRLTVRGESPPNPKLDPSEHEAYEWMSPEAALAAVNFPQVKEAIFRACNPPIPLTLSKSGKWFQDGEEITHARTVELFHRSLVRKGNGFVVRVADGELPVILEDVPYFVAKVDRQAARLELLSGEEVELDPATLEFGSENILYCRVHGESAKFLRSAYYELMQAVDEKPQPDGSVKYMLHWSGRNYELRTPGE